MSGFKKINFKNKIIFYLDGEGASKDEAIKIIDDYEQAIINEPLRSAYVLINVNNFTANIDIISRFNKNHELRVENTKRMALVGLSGMSKVAYEAYQKFENRKGRGSEIWFKAFDNLETAKEWLITD